MIPMLIIRLKFDFSLKSKELLSEEVPSLVPLQGV